MLDRNKSWRIWATVVLLAMVGVGSAVEWVRSSARTDADAAIRENALPHPSRIPTATQPVASRSANALSVDAGSNVCVSATRNGISESQIGLDATSVCGNLARVQPAPASRNHPGVSPLDYRASRLPAKTKGGSERILREWLVTKGSGSDSFPAHLEEEYVETEDGSLQLVGSREYVANRIIVKVDGETSDEAFRARVEALGGTVKAVLMTLRKGARLVSVSVPEVSLDATAHLMDMVHGIDACSDPSLAYVRTASAKTPNDQHYWQQWGLSKISAPAAWDIQTDASGVVVAVLDTGVNYNHEDLSGNMWENPSPGTFSGVQNDRHGMRCTNLNLSGDPMDDNGHGSHCAGIIGAVGNNGKGVSGVCWKTRIMALKAGQNADDGESAYFLDDDVFKCLEYARTMGAKVVNCSFGGTGSRSAAEVAAYEAMREAKIIVVCAAGNGGNDGVGDNNDTLPHYPSSLESDNIISVACTTSADELKGYSNFGVESVDIAAPGDRILSTWMGATTDYCFAGGTSMAAPYVSGAAALVWAKYPSASYSEIISRILKGGDALSALSGKVKTGMRLNVLKALQSATIMAPTVTATRGAYDDRVAVGWNAVSGASHYKVWRAKTSSGEKTALSGWITATEYDDKSGDAGQGYYYFAKAATSASGANASEFSAGAYGYRTSAKTYPDEWDPGDDVKTGATALTPAGTTRTHGPHGLNATDTVDWFKVNMTAGRGYLFESTGNYDLYAELYNASGARVAYNDDGGDGDNFKLSYTAATTGWHYLKVVTAATHEGAANTGTSTYSLKYGTTYPDKWDPADDKASGGTVLAPQTSVQTTPEHGLNASDTYDFFKLSLSAGETYAFESVSTADMYAELYRQTTASSATLVKQDDDSGEDRNFKLVYTPTAAGTYYLRVRTHDVGSEATYCVKYWTTTQKKHDLVFARPKDWSAAMFLSTDSKGTAAMTEFNVGDTVYIRYAFADMCDNGIADTFTNLIYLIDHAAPTKYDASAYDVFKGLEAGMYWECKKSSMTLRRAGSYTFGIKLNDPRRITETNYVNNVRTVNITVVDGAAKTLQEVSVTGPDTLVAGGSCQFACSATFSDGTRTNDVPATWSVVPADGCGSFGANGQFTARDVKTSTNVTVKASYTYRGTTKTATRDLTINPVKTDPFGSPVVYPTPPMTVVAEVTLDGEAAAAGDVLAAYCGSELRGRAVLSKGGVAALQVYVAEAGEQILFKAWDGRNGEVLACADALEGAMGSTVGTPEEPHLVACCSSDPFGTVPQQPNAPMTIVGRVSIYGKDAEVRDMVGAFCGSELRGKASVRLIDGVSYVVLTVQVRENGEKLSFRVWDASAEKLGDSPGTVDAVIGGTVGSPTEPIRIALLQDVTQNVKLSGTGWRLFSVNVTAAEPTPARILGSVAQKLERLTCGSEVYAPSWEDAYNTLTAIMPGHAYWAKVSATATDGVAFSLTGTPVDCETAAISLKAGWNCIGYNPQQAGSVRAVLARLIASGKLVQVSGDSCVFYPAWTDDWNTLKSMRPGAGYWVNVKEDVSFAYVEPAGSELASSVICGSLPSGCPWDADSVEMDQSSPTVIKGQVKVYGAVAACGDVVVAAFANGSSVPCAVQEVNAAGGVALSINKSSKSVITFKVWDVRNKVVYDSETSITLVLGEDYIEKDIVVSGTPPTYEVTFDLSGISGGNGRRTGGGALVQTVARNGAAVAPTVEADAGYRFVTWDREFSQVKESMTVHACYAVEGQSTYIIRFMRNDGSGQSSSKAFTRGVATRIPSLASLGWGRRGMVFKGWATSMENAKAGKIKYKDWQLVSTAADVGKTLDLYAVWALAADAYAIQYVRNDGAGTVRTVGFTYGKQLKLNTIGGLGWARRGYDFVGWATSTDKARSGTVWKKDGASVSTAAKAGKLLTVYAIWKLKSGYYEIRFNKNDGTGKWRALGYECGKSVKLPTCANGLAWSRDGYEFKGWATSAAKATAGTAWKTDGAYVKDATKTGKTLNVYAIWTKTAASSVRVAPLTTPASSPESKSAASMFSTVVYDLSGRAYPATVKLYANGVAEAMVETEEGDVMAYGAGAIEDGELALDVDVGGAIFVR